MEDMHKYEGQLVAFVVAVVEAVAVLAIPGTAAEVAAEEVVGELPAVEVDTAGLAQQLTTLGE